MKTEKMVYCAPTSRVFSVRLSQSVLQGSLNGEGGGGRFADPNADVVDGGDSIFW